MSATPQAATNRPRAGFFSPARFETTIYFDGPFSKFKRSPDDREILARKSFRFEVFANAYGVAITRRFTNIGFLVKPP